MKAMLWTVTAGLAGLSVLFLWSLTAEATRNVYRDLGYRPLCMVTVVCSDGFTATFQSQPVDTPCQAPSQEYDIGECEQVCNARGQAVRSCVVSSSGLVLPRSTEG